MSCKEIRKSLGPYLEGMVSPEQEHRVRKHVEECPACRASLEELKKTAAMARGLDEVEPPPWLSQRIMARVRDEAQKADQEKGYLKLIFHPFHIKIPLQAMAAVLIVILAVHLYKFMEPQIAPVPEPMKAKESSIRENAQIQDHALQARDTGQPGAKKIETAHPEKLLSPEVRERTKADGAGNAKPAESLPLPGGGGGEKSMQRAEAPPRQDARPDAAPSAVPPEPPRAVYPFSGPSSGAAAFKSDEAVTGPAAEKRRTALEKKAADRESGLRSRGSESPVAVDLMLRATDPPKIALEIEDLMLQIGADRISRRTVGESQLVSAEMDREKAAALVEKIKSLGRIVPGSTQLPSGRMTLRITLFSE